MAVKPIPEGYHSVTPYLCVKGAAQAIEFYKKALPDGAGHFLIRRSKPRPRPSKGSPRRHRASRVKAKRRVRTQFAGGVGTLVPNATFRSSPLKG